jgi:hypothetical protein
MNPQPDLFAAEQAKARAIDVVEANADEQWLGEALAAVARVAGTVDKFTTDDVWAALASRSWLSGKGPVERRAMGAVMRMAMRQKIARPLNELRPSVSSVNHSRPLRVWRKWWR